MRTPASGPYRALLAVFLAALAAGAAGPAYSGVERFYLFKIGEKASYDVEAQVDLLPFIKGVVGRVDVEMHCVTNLDRRETYHCVFKAYTLPSFISVYNLDDVFQTWFDCEELKTRQIQKKVLEGGWQDYITNCFFPDEGYGVYYTKSTSAGGNRYEMDTNSCDIMTLLYRLRSADKSAPFVTHWIADQGQSRALKILFMDSPGIEIAIHGQKARVETMIARDIESGIQIYLACDYGYLPVKVVIPSFKVAGLSISVNAFIRDYTPGVRLRK